ncbi:hypothetical protein M422DRAFT_66837 [Sphaerobolus stellatus SS14]|uniref:Uncharacterized protein n=1 Tax=Sphaerobolus stellatus (strain SS14) TaxID=990650 RepID=A0A0C9UU08_SPHS4|nr:hypothetical protein M422DRAFT_66837 [Sphaerobolus stellatus SS14]
MKSSGIKANFSSKQDFQSPCNSDQAKARLTIMLAKLDKTTPLSSKPECTPPLVSNRRRHSKRKEDATTQATSLGRPYLRLSRGGRRSLNSSRAGKVENPKSLDFISDRPPRHNTRKRSTGETSFESRSHANTDGNGRPSVINITDESQNNLNENNIVLPSHYSSSLPISNGRLDSSDNSGSLGVEVSNASSSVNSPSTSSSRPHLLTHSRSHAPLSSIRSDIQSDSSPSSRPVIDRNPESTNLAIPFRNLYRTYLQQILARRQTEKLLEEQIKQINSLREQVLDLGVLVGPELKAIQQQASGEMQEGWMVMLKECVENPDMSEEILKQKEKALVQFQ